MPILGGPEWFWPHITLLSTLTHLADIKGEDWLIKVNAR